MFSDPNLQEPWYRGSRDQKTPRLFLVSQTQERRVKGTRRHISLYSLSRVGQQSFTTEESTKIITLLTDRNKKSHLFNPLLARGYKCFEATIKQSGLWITKG